MMARAQVRKAGMPTAPSRLAPGEPIARWNTSSLSDSACVTPGLICVVSAIASNTAATTLPSTMGSDVQQAKVNQCLNPRGTFVILATISQTTSVTSRVMGSAMNMLTTEPHSNVVRVIMPMTAARLSGSTAGLLPNIISLNQSTSTTL